MKKIFVFIIMSMFVSHIVSAQMLTKSVMNKLAIGQTAQNTFSSHADTSSWQCGMIDGHEVRYAMSEKNIMAYDTQAARWYNLVAPFGAEVPAVLFAFVYEKGGVVRLQPSLRIVQCQQQQTVVHTKQVPHQEDMAIVPVPQVVVKPVEKIKIVPIQHKQVVSAHVREQPIPTVVIPSTSQDNVGEAVNISEFVEIYKQHQQLGR